MWNLRASSFSISLFQDKFQHVRLHPMEVCTGERKLSFRILFKIFKFYKKNIIINVFIKQNLLIQIFNLDFLVLPPAPIYLYKEIHIFQTYPKMQF